MSVNGFFPTETSINLHIIACIISLNWGTSTTTHNINATIHSHKLGIIIYFTTWIIYCSMIIIGTGNLFPLWIIILKIQYLNWTNLILLFTPDIQFVINSTEWKIAVVTWIITSIVFVQGKLTAQIGHASLGVYQTTPTDILTKWEEDGLHSRLYSGSETIIQGLIQAAQQNNIQYRNGSFSKFFIRNF